MEALGFIEVSGTVAAVEAIDSMLKTADVKFVTWEKKLGGRLVTIIVKGDVAAVTEAVEVGSVRANAITKTVAHAVIGNPHPEILKMIKISSDKLSL